jgi:hypothetical protein
MDKHWTYVFRMPRTLKLINGKYVRDSVHHLPKSCYRRRASWKRDGRRRNYWVFMRCTTLHQSGDVTIVLSEKWHNDEAKNVKLSI